MRSHGETSRVQTIPVVLIPLYAYISSRLRQPFGEECHKGYC